MLRLCGSALLVGIGARCGWTQLLGAGEERCRPAGHSWLWRGPVDPVLWADGFVLASGGPRLSQSGERRKCVREGGGGERPAAKHPPTGLLRGNSNLRGC